jgi:DNA-binding IclR family transcriptional regulator
LDAFGDRHRLSLQELCATTGLPKSTVHRLAEQLAALGWLERDPIGYRVGLRLFEVGSLAERRSRLRDRAAPHLNALFSATNLTVQLAILDGASIIYLERILAPGSHLPTRDGGRQPAYCTALGKAMLAYAGAPTIESVIADGLPRRTPHTLVTAAALQAELGRIREEGVAFDRGEAYPGITCVAAPIRDVAGLALGAVSVTGPGPRLLRLTGMVSQAAAAISRDRRLSAR